MWHWLSALAFAIPVSPSTSEESSIMPSSRASGWRFSTMWEHSRMSLSHHLGFSIMVSFTWLIGTRVELNLSTRSYPNWGLYCSINVTSSLSISCLSNSEYWSPRRSQSGSIHSINKMYVTSLSALESFQTRIALALLQRNTVNI